MVRHDGGVIQGLDEAALAVLFDVGVREHVERGTAVVREGDPGGEVWVLLSGACDVDVQGDRIATLGPGQLFGEIAALTRGPRTASVTAADTCDLLRLTPDALASAMARSAGLMNHLLHTLASRSRVMTRREGAARDEHRELARLEEAMLPSAEVFARSRRFRHEVNWRPYSIASGDYCDIMPLGDERYMIALGDVLGHGASTSLTIGAARGQTRELTDQGVSPEALMPRLDQHLVNHGPPGMHLTLLVAVIDGESSTARIVTAGHPAPMRWRDGQAEQLEVAPGPLLGYGLAAGDYPVFDLDLRAGDRLLFFTDGISEVRVGSDGEMIGEAGLCTLFGAACAEATNGVMDVLVGRLDALPGMRPPDDDATMLILRVDS